MLAVLAPDGRMRERYSEMFLVLQLRGPLSEVPVGGILMPLLGEKISPAGLLNDYFERERAIWAYLQARRV